MFKFGIAFEHLLFAKHFLGYSIDENNVKNPFSHGTFTLVGTTEIN
jgi:hypothetical protein